MKNKFIYTIILIILICLIPIVSFGEGTIDDVVGDGKNFLSKADPTNTVINQENLKNLSDTVYNLILSIGMVIAVAIGSIIGIKFMYSTIEEKAKIKEILVIYVIGCIVLFGAFSIWKAIVQILNVAR